MTTTSIPTAPLGTLDEPRLLAAGPQARLAEHLSAFGPLPKATKDRWILAEWELSNLAGRGGGAFPTSQKIAAVLRSVARTGRAPVVIGNGSEGEPLSHKDRMLLTHAPHLVLDGLALTARIIGANESYLVAEAVDHPLLKQALAERGDTQVELHASEDHFLAGQATAVLSSLEGGASLPQNPRWHLSDLGLGGAPTLLLNVETLAHLALIARYSAMWFRTVGTNKDPGSRLLTVHDQGQYQVVEVHGGCTLDLVLDQLGINPHSAQAVLVGGFHGTWSRNLSTRLVTDINKYPGTETMAAGAGVIELLPHGNCPLVRTAEIVNYLAKSSAGQCGPCVHGLPTLARDMHALATLSEDFELPERIARLSSLVTGRGACHHPDATARLALSSLQIFDDELNAHLNGTCLHTTEMHS